MAGLVKCDICEKVFNKSTLASHKRLAHDNPALPGRKASEPETIEAIESLLARLSEEGRRKVLERVFAAFSSSR